METTPLFPGMDLSEVEPDQASAVPQSHQPPRVRRPDRDQALMQSSFLDDILPPDHPARAIWAVVERLELSKFYEPLKARGSDPGRSATDPKLLIALWLYATVEGLGSGRELERLCGCYDAFRWLCGGLTVNDHTLNDFRVGHEKALDDLFTQVLAVLMGQHVVTVQRISQDGTKVRASAGSKSFRREASLQRRLEEAKAQVQAVKQWADDATLSAQQRAARARAAKERAERITAALAELPKIREDQEQVKNKKPNAKATEPRASMTDADARIMKMPDHGFRPAYNVQLAADTHSRAIVAVEVTNARSDHQQSEPIRQQVEQRTGAKVEEHLLDGGYVQWDSIETAETSGTKIYAPPPNSRKSAQAFEPKKNDGPGTVAWRRRMGQAATKPIYSQRASTSETINADLRTFRGLSKFVVRGLNKVQCQALWSALAYNLMHFATALIT